MQVGERLRRTGSAALTLVVGQNGLGHQVVAGEDEARRDQRHDDGFRDTNRHRRHRCDAGERQGVEIKDREDITDKAVGNAFRQQLEG